MVYLFSPEYGVGLYGERSVIWQGIGVYTLTSQELFYLLNLVIKYLCTIPLAIIFLMTTHPSQFASSLNQIGVSYKIALFSQLDLALYSRCAGGIPDYQALARSQRLGVVQKGKLCPAGKGKSSEISPLIFSSLERIETISTAMELRRFGKNKKRTWYTYQEMTTRDRLIILGSIFMVILSIVLIWVNKGRFYNPWR